MIQKLYVTILLLPYTRINMQTESNCNSSLLLSLKYGLKNGLHSNLFLDI